MIFLYDTLKVPCQPYDKEQVAARYEVVSRYLGVDQPDVERLNFSREQARQTYAVGAAQRPNVICVMLESLGTSAVGAYGNPLQGYDKYYNTRISQIPHVPPVFEKPGLESNQVPLLIHAPGLARNLATDAVSECQE